MRRAVAVGLLILLGARPANAFVQETNGNKPFLWSGSCVPVTIYLDGFEADMTTNDGMSVDDIVKSVAAAAHAWSAVDCPSGGHPSLEIVPTLAALSAASPAVTYDARNTLVFDRSAWPFDPATLAHTRPTTAPDGRLLDVDIEVNAASPGLVQWMDLDPGVVIPPGSAQQTEGVGIFDLQTALTHEFGHFIGLAHTCFRPELGEPQLDDDRGVGEPDCSDPALAPELHASVMFATTEPRQSQKRELGSEDVRAVCAIYPPARAATCPLDTAPPGCAAAAPRDDVGLAGLAVGAALVGGARRRRRQRS
jgi:hypothetical protein